MKNQVPAPEPDSFKSKTSVRRSTRKYVWIVALVAAATLITGLLVWKFSSRQQALATLWGPVVKQDQAVLICVGEVNFQRSFPASESAQSNAPDEFTRGNDMIILKDVDALTKVSGIIGRMGGYPKMLGVSSTSFADIQGTSGVFMGAFNNSWTLRLQAPLRYQFVRNPTEQTYGILDTKNPQSRLYQIDKTKPHNDFTQDYGIVARFHSPTTERDTVIIAGIGANGTQAATAMATDEHFFDQAVLTAGHRAMGRNLEMLVASQIIENHAGPPKVIDIQTW